MVPLASTSLLPYALFHATGESTPEGATVNRAVTACPSPSCRVLEIIMARTATAQTVVTLSAGAWTTAVPGSRTAGCVEAMVEGRVKRERPLESGPSGEVKLRLREN
jgi:hypothetical protein